MHATHTRAGLRYVTTLFFAALSLVLVLSAAQNARAQDATTTPRVKQSQAVLVADINFESISMVYSTSTRTLKATASMRNNLGDLSDGVFGLEISAGASRDAAFSPEHIALTEGARTTRSVTLQIPYEFSGAVSATAVIKSSTGVILAAHPVWSGTVASTLSGPAPISCTRTGSASLSCIISKGDYALSYTVYQNALGGRERLPVTDTSTGGKTVSIPNPALPPGQYAVLIHVLGAQKAVLAARAYTLSVDGPQGSIDTFLLQPQGGGAYLITATTHVRANTGDFTLTLQGKKDGASCGTPLVLAATSSVTQTLFKPGCAADSVAATLAAGPQVLDTSSAYIFPRGTAGSPWLWLAILAAIVIGALGIFALRRKPSSPPITPPNPPTPYA